MLRTPLLLAILRLVAAEPASAFLPANTIDRYATSTQAGARVWVTGPIGCTPGERIANAVTVTQPATDARARKRWTRRCTGELQHWQVRARARHALFATGGGRVCAVATTRAGSRVTDTRRLCEPVRISGRFP